MYLLHRFAPIWFKREFVLAAVSHPAYQTQWVKNAAREEEARRLLREEFDKLKPSDSLPATPVLPAENEHEHSDSVFDFEPPSAKRRAVSELDRFFEEPSNDLQCLHALPTLKKIFLKYNTPAPSSATLERAFCTAGAILSKKGVSSLTKMSRL